MSEIHIIGMDGAMSREKEQLLRHCILIVAAPRFSETLADYSAARVPITPLEQAFVAIEAALPKGDVAVLASGDPLFYGIGERILQRFGPGRVNIVPALSAVQQACARFKIPWHDAAVVSLHGRRPPHVPGLLLARRKTLVFTDTDHSPDRIARLLLDYLAMLQAGEVVRGMTLHVGEDLGGAREKIGRGTPEDIARGSFASPNMLAIELAHLPARPVFGLLEEEMAHSRGLITKNEVRAATLHRLRLPRAGVFWDIGGGSGSISIEAAAMCPQLTVYCIEHKDEQLSNIRKNIRRFGLFNIVPVAGRAANLLATLPEPDVIFVGGNGGELPEIVAQAASRLSRGGRLVINGVLPQTIERAPALMRDQGLAVETTTMTIHRDGPHGRLDLNPITIMVGRK